MDVANKNRITTYLKQVIAVLDSMPLHEIGQVVDALLDARRRGARVFIFGNGGSAATASHFACDLGKGAASPDQDRFKVVALTDNVPLITAWANDTAYDNVFAEQLTNLMEAGDVVIGISASGNSPNVLRALDLARRVGCTTIGFTGFDGGDLKGLADICVVVPSQHMGQVEDAHVVLVHLITSCLA